MVKPIHRLKENRDFRRTFARGKSYATPRLVLYFAPTKNQAFRVGFSVSKKVGNAVVRNRMKRLLRECFLRYEPVLSAYRVDFVVVCRPAAATCSLQELDKDLQRLLARGNFVVS